MTSICTNTASAALLVGLAEAVRDDAVAYASERVQFGKPIGVFQAIKHPCADMAVRCEAALSQTMMAALHVRDGLPDAEFQAASAKVVVRAKVVDRILSSTMMRGRQPSLQAKALAVWATCGWRPQLRPTKTKCSACLRVALTRPTHNKK